MSIRRFLQKAVLACLTFIFFTLSLAAAVSGATICVSPAGDDVAGDGTALSPFRSITKGVQSASAFDIVQADYGTYRMATIEEEDLEPGRNTESFPILLPNDVTVRGMGWQDTLVLSDGTNGVFVNSGTTGIAIQDLTISGGGGSAGGIALANASGTISRTRITGNVGGFGGGISLASNCPNVRIENCIIDNNTALFLGGGICIEMGSQAQVINCTVYGNLIDAPGPFAFGSGVYNGSMTSAVYNSIIYKNRVGDPVFGSASDNYYSSADPPVLAAYSIIESSSYGYSGDPDLVSPETGDFRPELTSPAVDQGNSDYMGQTAPVNDINGSPRPITVYLAGIDIGAFEVGDETAPTGSISIDSGAVSTTSVLAELNVPVTDEAGGSGLFRARYSNNGSTWSAWRDYTDPFTDWDLTAAIYGGNANSGVKTVYAQFKDHAGNVLDVSDSIVLNPAPPTGSIFINNDAAYTNSNSVTLNLSAVEHSGYPVNDMRFSEDGTFDTELWVGSYSTTYPWTLPAGDGPKTVYVQFRDSDPTIPPDPPGNVSSAYDDSIILDTAAPVSSGISINAGDVYTTSNMVELTVSADDPDAEVRFSNNHTDWSPWEEYTGAPGGSMVKTGWPIGGGQGENIVYVQFRDQADNSDSGSEDSDTIVYDNTPPAGSITINDGFLYTSENIVALAISASDNLSGVVEMQLSNDSLTWPGGWDPFTEPITTAPVWDLTVGAAGQGLKTVYVILRDGAGNSTIAGDISDSIDWDSDAVPNAVYRFYNFRQGVHFFTIDASEAQYVRDTAGSTFRDEGTAFNAFPGYVSGTVPIHRFYNYIQGVHFYTANQAEATYVNDNLWQTFRYEGIAYYAFPGAVVDSLPVYRFYNFLQGAHFYTADPFEAQYIRDTAGWTFRDEGVACYVPAR